MKLSVWAKSQGIKYKTAHRWFKSNMLPVKAIQMKTGTIIVYPEQEYIRKENCIIYARVSSHDQKEDLTRQLQRLRDFCAIEGFVISDEISEIASGLNSTRAKLNKILLDKSITTIVVEHKDRLTRFGFELIESALNADKRKIVVINKTEEKNDLVQDFIDVVTSLCAKIYGRRSARNKAMRAFKEIER